MLRRTLIILLLLASGFSYATIYQYTDASGNTVYTNQYHENAKPVDLPKVEQISAPKGKTKATPEANTKTQDQLIVQTLATQQYTTFNIASPSNGQTFHNQRDITLKLNVQPKLKQGDKIAVYIDGGTKPYFVGSQIAVSLNTLDRGEHKIQARLLDANNKVLRISSEITIYVHYAAVGKRSTELVPPAQKLNPAIQPVNPPIQNLTPPTKPITP